MTSPRYFGGSSRNLGEAKGLAAKNFRDFAQLLVGVPVVLPLTRRQYESLDKPSRMTAKRVNWFTPATFKTNPSTTGKENVVGANLVVLDLDDPAQAAPLAKAATLASLLQPFSWVAYRTASSTPSCPRLRIVVDAELGADDYLGAVFTVARLLGVEVNRESKRTAQPSFLPSLFADEDPDIDHPMIGCETGGRAFLSSDIDRSALEGEHPVGQEGQAAPVPVGDDLEHLRAPMPGVTLDACREALNHLDPDMPMHDWVQVAFALKHQFQGEREMDAYNLFLEWSSRGKKYAGEKDIETRWRSCKVATVGRAPVTVRSLLRMALTAGWKGMVEVSKLAFEELDRKISNLKTPVELLEQAPKLLVHSTLSPVERGALIGQVVKMAKQLGITLGRRDIEKSVARLTKAGAAGDGEGGGKSLPDWARGWVYVAGEDEFFNSPRGTKREIDAFNRENMRHVVGADEDEAQAPAPSKLLLNTYLCPVVDGYQYDPGRPEEVVFEDELGRVWANTYTARHPRGDALGADDARRVFLGHLQRLVGDEDTARRLMDWLAYHVQAPGRKVRWAPLIQGTQGCGKTYIAEVMARVLGESNVHRLDAGQVLEDGFNGWGNEAQLVVLEEVRVVGESRYKVMNKLKPLITNSTVSIRRMYHEAVSRKNVTNYLLLTNFLDSLPVDENDRRYFVIHSPLQTKAQKEAAIDPYRQEMWDTLDKNASGFRAMFEEWPISMDFDPDGDAPDTASKSELVRNTETPLSSLLRRLSEEGTNPLITKTFVSLTALRHEAEVEGLRNVTGQVLSQACREAGYVMSGRQRMADGERHSVWRRADDSQVAYDEDGI